jgi:hypothetical protein
VRVLVALTCALALGGCISDPRPMPLTQRAAKLELYGRPDKVSTQPDGTQIVTWRRHAGKGFQIEKFTFDHEGNIVKAWDWRDPS